jgi:TRAP-type C4-dicarboxylate transport system permease small subunit
VQTESARVLGPVRALRLRLESLARLMNYVAGWAFVVCALFVTGDVVGRSMLGVSSAATVEITGYLLAFGLSWALAHALAQRSHIRVDTLVNKVPPTVRPYLHIVALALLLVFVVFAAWCAIGLVEESLLFDAVDNSALKIPLIVPQGLWSFGIAVLALLAFVMVAECVLLVAAGQGAQVNTLLGSRTIEDEAHEALEAVAMAYEDGR